MKKVLIVEDDLFISDISAIKLTQHGYEVVAVKDGSLALEKLATETFSVVLLDLDIPGISGKELLEKLRKSENHKSQPVIVFSNRDDDQLKSEMKQLGISGYFVKASTDYTEIFSVIDQLKQ